ncbi:MAG: hypothetical protein KDJ16_01370 [Hyphomicrobiales bacterium]|nr:hypothetical protein [Hyphomicrobiales bacterium]
MGRLAVTAIILLVVANAASALFATSVPSRFKHDGDDRFMVIYVGADDCMPCVQWRKTYRNGFVDSPEFAKLEYHELVSEKLKTAFDDENWPAHLRRYRDTSKAPRGAPTWIMVRGESVVATAGGLSSWPKQVWPMVQEAVR